MKKLSALIAAVLLLGVLLAGCAPTVPGGDPDGEVVSNGKIAVQQGGYIYYINGSMPQYLNQALESTPIATIFRMNADGTDKRQISSKKAYDFRIYGDKIYYLSPLSKDELVIYRIGINGGAPERILSFENKGVYAFGEGVIAVEKSNSVVLIDPATGKTVSTLKDVGNVSQIFISDAGDVYYYISNVAGIMRVNGKGEDSVKLTDRNGRIVGVKGNLLYYIKNDQYLHSVDMTAGTETKLSYSEYDSMQLSIENGAFVGVSKEEGKVGLYIMPLDGGTRTKILDQAVEAYLISDHTVYFCNKAEGALYSVDFEGKNLMKVADVAAAAGPNTTGGDYYMDVVGDKLFFFETLYSGNAYMLTLSDGGVLTKLNG